MAGPWESYQEAAPPNVPRITVTPADSPEAPTTGPWSNYASGAVNTGLDAVTSFGRGVAKGAISLAGLPGDLEQLIGKGVKAAGTALGVPPPPEADAIAAEKGLPTQASITKRVEDVAGPFQEPQTHLGHDVQSVGEFVPAALAGPGGMVRKLATLAVVPGVASEEAGRATEGTSLEPYKPYIKAGAAIASGVGASMLGGAGTSTNALRKQLPEYVTDAHVTQAESLIGDAAARGVQLTWPEALSQVTGRPVLTDMQRVLESSPRTRATMQEVHGERPQQIATAAENEFQNVAPATNAPSTVGPAVSQAAEQTVTGIRSAINQATRPMYDAAGQHLVPQQVHAAMIADPLFEDALNAVRNNPAKNSFVRGQSDRSIHVYDAVAKELEERARNAAAPINPNASQAVASATGSLGGDIKDIAIAAERNAVGGPSSYEAALATQASLREKYLNPVIAGPLGRIAEAPDTKRAIEALFPAKPLAGSEREVGDAVSALAKKNPWAARQLVRAHLEQKLDEAFNAAGRGQEAAQFAGASFANRTLGSPVVDTQRFDNMRAAVEALPNGPQIWNGLSRFFEIAQATGTRQPKGSMTAFNEAELKGMSSGSMAGNAAKVGLSPGRWWSWANDAWTKWQLGQNLDQLARIITDPSSARLLQRIARAPRNSNEAHLTAARIIAGSNAASAEPQKKP